MLKNLFRAVAMAADPDAHGGQGENELPSAGVRYLTITPEPGHPRLGAVLQRSGGGFDCKELPDASVTLRLGPGESLTITRLEGRDLDEYLKIAGMAPAEPGEA